MTDKLRDAALWKLLTEAREALWQPANPDLCGRIDEALAQQETQKKHKPLFAEMIAQHPGLAEELAQQDAPPAHPAEHDSDGLPLVVAGAIFDFAGYISTRSKTIEVGSTADAGQVADLVKEWAKLRGLSLDSAAVLSWQEWLPASHFQFHDTKLTQNLKWQKAPIRTEWGSDMVVASIAIDKDHTADLYCECYQAHRIEAMLNAAPTPQAQAATCKQDLQVDTLLDEMLDTLPYNSPDYWIGRIREVRYGTPTPQALAKWDEYVETACALIKAADDAAADGDYMLDSNDCIKVLRGQWKAPLANDCPPRPQPTQQEAQAVPQGEAIVEEFSAWLNERRGMSVAWVFHDVVAKFRAMLNAAPTPPAQAVEQDPCAVVKWQTGGPVVHIIGEVQVGDLLYRAAPTPPAPKPLGWLDRKAVECLQGPELNWMPAWNRPTSADPVPVFLGPPTRATLTASEILNMTPESIPAEHDGALLEYARAVIEAYERKNGKEAP